MNSSDFFVSMFVAIIYGTGILWSYFEERNEFDEAVYWPIYAFKWLIKGLWKAISSW